MTQTLPERPDWEQLKRQAKELLKGVKAGDRTMLEKLPSGETVSAFSLHDAQRVIARSYGFGSWTKLKVHVETLSAAAAEKRLIEAAIGGDTETVRTVLTAHLRMLVERLAVAAVLADVRAVRTFLDQRPESATQVGGPRSWPAMLYLCYGRVGGGDSQRAEIARSLLAHGADPNSSFLDPTWPEAPMPALYGATGASNYPQLARVLLEAGANPNDSESRYHAAEHFHRECLELLKEFGADWSAEDRNWGNTPLYFLFGYRNPPLSARQGIRWMLENGANPNVASYRDKIGETPLHAAVRFGWDLHTIDLLLSHGADPLKPRNDGRTAFALAVRAGRDEVVERFRAVGKDERPSSLDLLLGAALKGNRAEARAILSLEPALLQEMSLADRRLMNDAAEQGRAQAIEILVEIGFDVNWRDPEGGATALHLACWYGQAAAVEVLLRCGARHDICDHRFHAAAVGWCAHGSVHCRAPGSDYVACMRSLVAYHAEIPPGTEGNEALAEVLRTKA